MDSLYSQYIHKSRYARYLDEKDRREHWDETVSRLFSFLHKKLEDTPVPELAEIEQAVLRHEVMPSMRSLMTAGKALDRDSTCGYNCSFLPVDDPKSFDEAMHILMCGTGVGFSVERQYVNKLPEVPDELFDSDTTIIVKDSKEGWAKALRQLIALLYSGEIARWDVSKVRSAGSRLKIFGGRASGPAPLEELFRFVISIFRAARGRKLTSLECHDIMCKIGEVVVVGGVRRSAMISLSNLSDDRMRHAKSGAWWEQNPQRALSNNSAVYDDKPDIGIFMDEWLSLYNSKSGERGMFNREASKLQAAKNNRRDTDYQYGTNPCSEIILRPYQFCNLSSVIVRPDDTKESLKRKIRYASILGTIQSTFVDFPYLRKIWKKNTQEERLLGVSLTGIYDNPLTYNYKRQSFDVFLEELKQTAVDTNKEFAGRLGIEQSAAITCIKPEGTLSQLTNSASGIHPRYDHYYVRRVRNDVKDPIAKFLIENGVPYEADVMNPHNVIFSFPMRVDDTAITRNDISAIDHLELVLQYQRHYCEHKPSVTIQVKEDEWMEVGAWVWKHFDELAGVSFLPYDTGTYRQAPYEKISKEEYDKMISTLPDSIDWNALVEANDLTEAAQTLACTSAQGCEL